MAEISYVNTVNVNLSATPSGMSDFVVANIGLFTHETANFADEYRVYVSPSVVGEDFGTDSLTFKIANAIFAQTPNLRSGNGSLVIAPYKATSATFGTFETPVLSGNLDNIKAVANGGLLVEDAGIDIKITQLNFTGVKTIADIAKVITDKNPDYKVIATEEGKLLFTSNRAGEDSVIRLKELEGSTFTDLYGASYFNGVGGDTQEGSNANDEEGLSNAVARVNGKIFFGGVLDTVIRDNTSILENATGIEAISKKVYVPVTRSLNNIGVLGKAIKDGGYRKTKLVAYSYGTTEDALCMAGAYLSKALCTNYRGSNTCITMNLKELATIQPDTNCGDNTLQQARVNGVDIYGSTSGLSCVYSCRNAGGYMDDITGIASFTGELEVAGFNYLRQTNTKVPQTEAGMTGLKNCLAQVCERYVTNGFLGTGLTWNSSEKFGDPEDFDRNIEENGYYMYSLPVAQQAQSEREARIAPLVQIACKSAGAIHIINVNGTVEA